MNRLEQRTAPWIGTGLILFLIIGLGLAIRLAYFINTDFPLNDGGMFYEMTIELQQNHFKLPLFTNYNSSSIPYAYPPLPLYLAGIIQSLSGHDLITIYKFLPVIFNILTIPAFFYLSLQVLEKNISALYSTLVFAILPPGFDWLIMGGGVIRAPGFFASILALGLTVRALKHRDKTALLVATLFAGFTVLSHLETALITFVWIAIASFFISRNRWGLIVFLTESLGAMIISSPWWISIISVHGIEPYLNALSSGEFLFTEALVKLLVSNITAESLFAASLIFALLGLFHQVIRKNWLLPAWFFGVVIFDARGLERSILIPISMLAGIAIDQILIPGLIGNSAAKPIKTRVLQGIVATLILFLLLRGSIISQLFNLSFRNVLEPLSNDQIQAMKWIETNVPMDSRFLILTSLVPWELNKQAEWFPALTGHQSLNTVQGTEWLPGHRFKKQKEFYDEINACLLKEVGCLEAVAQHSGLDFTHIYLDGKLKDYDTHLTFPMPIESALSHSNSYELIYQEGQIMVFKRIIK
jgi:hypothetical protein